MKVFAHTCETSTLPHIGMIVLQNDARLETDLRAVIGPQQAELFISRIESGAEVTRETLTAMEGRLHQAASLLPPFVHFDVVGFGCTSASALIGSKRVRQLIMEGANTRHVTEPVSALVNACEKRGLKRLTILSPYLETVNHGLFEALENKGIAVDGFASFNQPMEAKVAAISPASITSAAIELGAQCQSDGVFLSCTNLNTLSVLDAITSAIGKPVLSSNSVLIEHLQDLAIESA